MIRINHNIQIFGKPEAFLDFYQNYDKHFVTLAPKNHLSFQFLNQDHLKVGTKTISKEVLLGRRQVVKHQITEITAAQITLKGLFPLSLIGGKLIFQLEFNDGSFQLNEILEFGFNSFIGKLLDPFLRLYLNDKYIGLSSHSKECLMNTKYIIENSPIHVSDNTHC